MTDGERAVLRAAADRIVPEDDYPSAGEAGVVEFLERLIVREGLEERYAAGLAEIEAEATERYGRSFIELPTAEQDAVLGALEPRSEFFELLAQQTIEGYYADPGNGGNRGAISWEMIGFRVTS